MYDLRTIYIACGKLVKRYDIFGVVILDFVQVGNLPVRFLWQIAAHLHIDALIAPCRYEVNYFRFVFFNIDLIVFSAKFKVHNVFQHCATDFGLNPIMQYFREVPAI